MSSSFSSSVAAIRASSSQPLRFPAALDPASAPVDGRTQAEVAALARTFAQGLAFWHLNDRLDKNGLWSKFFPDPAAQQAEAGAASCPQKALFLAFLGLYDEARIELNRITARHLEFYYRDVLGLGPRGPQPDEAHIVLSLKKTVKEVRIPAGTEFSTKAGLRYASEIEVFANRSELVHRRILARDAKTGRVRYAVEAASVDGLGEPLPEEDPAWHPFGHGQPFPDAVLGFAVSSPVLVMQEGDRKITVTLALAGITDSLTPESISAALTGYLSGEKEWLAAGSPTKASIARNGQGQTELSLTFSLDAKAGEVIAYDPTVLDGGFDTLAPVLKVLLLESAPDQVANALAAAAVRSIRIQVEVAGMKSLVLENDYGRLDPAKAFMPFGPSPRAGASFYVNAEEALTKDVTSVKLHLQWNSPPASFKTHYAGYTDRSGATVNSNAYFTADLEILRDGKFQPLIANTRLFEDDPSLVRTIDSQKSETPQITFGGLKYAEFATRFSRNVSVANVQMPFSTVRVAQPLKTLAASRVHAFRERILLPAKFSRTNLRAFTPNGFLRLRLKRDFLHDGYPEFFAQAVAHNQTEAGKKNPKTVPKPPYTPEVSSFTLDYTARSPLARPDVHDAGEFASRDVRFFHVTPFGQREEHRYIKQQISASSLAVTLLPAMENDGELYLGLKNLAARESISLLFQFLEGSANPLSTRQSIEWSVLGSNHWRGLKPEEILAERTDDFLVSGVVRLVLPAETSTANTLLEPGFAWLRASIKGDLTAVCRLLEIHSNAIPVTLANPGLATHLDSSLPAGTIAGAPPSLRGVKAVAQPYGSSRGVGSESTPSFHTRSSERLRHRRRAVTPWDFERLVLDRFPKIYRALCLPHTDRQLRAAPGCVTLVLIPDTRGKNQANPLTPFTDLATLADVEEFLAGLYVPFAQVAAINPLFEPIQLQIKVAFKAGNPFASYRPILEEDLKRHLSPWAYGDSELPDFGGGVLRSSLLAFIESLPYVDYLTELVLLPSVPSGDPALIQKVDPSTPASIITSAASHNICGVEPCLIVPA